MMRWIGLGFAMILLGACGQSISGDESYVTISNAEGVPNALPKATEYCAQWGRVPNFRWRIDYRVTFDCVEATSVARQVF
jgi:hypothetical protein